jgi:hypothetical protein
MALIRVVASTVVVDGLGSLRQTVLHKEMSYGLLVLIGKSWGVLEGSKFDTTRVILAIKVHWEGRPLAHSSHIANAASCPQSARYRAAIHRMSSFLGLSPQIGRCHSPYPDRSFATSCSSTDIASSGASASSMSICSCCWSLRVTLTAGKSSVIPWLVRCSFARSYSLNAHSSPRTQYIPDRMGTCIPLETNRRMCGLNKRAHSMHNTCAEHHPSTCHIHDTI